MSYFPVVVVTVWCSEVFRSRSFRMRLHPNPSLRGSARLAAGRSGLDGLTPSILLRPSRRREAALIRATPANNTPVHRVAQAGLARRGSSRLT